MTQPSVPARSAVAPSRFFCSAEARTRGDDLVATAPPARRFFLLEVSTPWPADVLAATGLPPDIARTLSARVNGIGARLLVIRRPHRRLVDPDGVRRWAAVALGAEPRWGEWRRPEDLLDLDLPDIVATLTPPTGSAPSRPLALVCTHGRHDVCCAVEGRPVLAAAQEDPRFDVWECSHLGGDRFAGNLLCLPSGLLFGDLDRAATPAVLDAAADGRVVLRHFRGRYGEAALVQAARWHLMQALGEDRPDAFRVEGVREQAVSGAAADAAPNTEVTARHGDEVYRVVVTWSRSEPHRLTCRATSEGRVRVYALVNGPTRLS